MEGRKQQYKGIYHIRINYYDDYRDKDTEVNCVALAEDFAEACRLAAQDFKYINDIYIEAIVDGDYEDCKVIYIDNDGVALKAIRENNDY